MNILHISSASTWRGGERQVNYLIEGLHSEGNLNFLMSPKKSILSERSNLNSSKLLEYKKGVFSIIGNIKVLKKYCEHHKIDLIHGHDSHSHTLLWMAYRFGELKTKSVITRRLTNPIKSRSIKKYNYRKIEKIICISEAVKNALLPSIRDQMRLTVIHSAIMTLPDDLGNRKKKNKNFVVGYVAAFTEEKDHITFVATARHLVNNHPERSYKFLLVGDGPLLENIKNESLDIIQNIQFTGFVDNVDQAYLDMHLLLHTSKSEALGTSILDAMKFGLPIVATNIGGIPEIVTHGENGFLCAVGDFKEMAEQINAIATDPPLYDEFSINSSKYIDRFDVSTMVQKTLNLYSEILK